MSSIVLANALLRDISKCYENADDYDVNLYVGQEPEIEVFQAHSFILPAADELTLTELVDHIQEHIISNEKGWLLENFVQVFQKISTYEAMRRLQDYCAELICNDPSVVFTSDFGSLEEPALLALLQRDDLVMDEIDIWECVIKWGLAKNKMIDPDVAKWTQRDFEAMERTLRNCIQCIRFFQIPAHEYFYKVRPYKKILPRNLKEDLQLFYIVPMGQPKFTPVLPPRMVSKQWIGFGVGDLHFLDGTCSPNDYEAKILDSTRYVVEDYEVFQILNKVKPGNSIKDRPSKPASIFGFM
ncbi:178_t:CDS:2 [Cetraspora pellucida]|uniref:178_t:CDS:1 n=2 Tax=Gigasporaceae TaxID=36753 RepID=A0A9N9BDN0_9GLOM|nr:178_t:CDS:2 [Cetraspora pellucida]